eukprot:jgi/Hompol1/123/HPOL_005235-RA
MSVTTTTTTTTTTTRSPSPQQSQQQLTTPVMAKSASTGSASGSGSGLRPSPQRSHLTRVFSTIECGSMRFVILDCPTDASLPDYLRELVARGVTDVVRVCEPTYATALLAEKNIVVHDWPFKDGGVPAADVINNFLALAESRFGGLSLDPKRESSETPCIAVHCVAGLGRAPVLVAVALIEAGMAPLDAIDFVRKHRRGAFNTIQMQFLADTYKRSKRSNPLSSFLSKRSSSPSVTSQSKLAATQQSASSESLSHSTPASSIRESFSRVFGLRRPVSMPTGQKQAVA